MTAVASPPSIQPLQRIGWNSGDGYNEAASMNPEDSSHIYIPRKITHRSSSSSSISSDFSTNTTISNNPSTDTAATESSGGNFGVGRGGRAATAVLEKEAWTGGRKSKSIWPGPRTEGAFSGTVGPGRPLGFSNVNGDAGLNSSHSTSVGSGPNTMQNVQQAGGGRVLPHTSGNDPQALLVLVPTNGTFERKSISVPLFPEILRIGRQTNAKTIPTATNGYFDSKVLSRQHAEVWADRNGKIWIRDVKSSNGTFVNAQRLSPESRDSEPHELRENDSLELGIDIVSEDQKSIVHHKVSAKVEHAGFPNSSANVMDLTFGDLDPGASNGLLTSMPNGLGGRARLGSQSSLSSGGSRMESQSAMRNGAIAFGVQRHMNSFLSPVSIETIMRRLNTELRQARQQSQDLQRTGEFFNGLLATEPGKEPPKAPASILPPKISTLAAPPLPNGLVPPSKLDHLSPFSAPPAPPPQLPLPEKPDAPRSAYGEGPASIPFKRNSVDSSTHLSNGKADSSSQILSLVETLQSTKRELDKQGNRVKELEELLRNERKAREMAEERARLLSGRQHIHANAGDGDGKAPVTPPEEEMSAPLVNGAMYAAAEGSDSRDEDATVNGGVSGSLNDGQRRSEMGGIEAASSIADLQDKLNKMVEEMEDVRRQLDSQRHRADTAEIERDKLVDMVHRIRQAETSKTPSTSKSKSDSKTASQDVDDETCEATNKEQVDVRATGVDGTDEVSGNTNSVFSMNGKPMGIDSDATKDKQIQKLQEALALALVRTRREDSFLEQSAPYLSVISVVVLGVSAMLYLNSLPKVER